LVGFSLNMGKDRSVAQKLRPYKFQLILQGVNCCGCSEKRLRTEANPCNVAMTLEETRREEGIEGMQEELKEKGKKR